MKLIKVLFYSLTLTASLVSVKTFADSQFVAGNHYQITSPRGSEEPMVEEFFNYACAACYSIESFIGDVKSKNPNIKFKMVPVELNPAWKIYVEAYYIAEKLNMLEKVHTKIFHRLHVEKKPFANEKDMKTFFLNAGVDEKAYDDVKKSYWLATQLRVSKQYAMKNGIMGTPTLLVNKRFKLVNKNLGTYEKIEQAIVELSGANKKSAAAVNN